MPIINPDAVTQICAYQKDDYYMNILRGVFLSNIRNIFGNAFALSWTKEINHFADAVYYCLTTAGSLQTLGEEYTNLIQVDSTKSKVASFKQRISMIALHTLFPLCLDKFLNHLERKLVSNQSKFSYRGQVYLFQAVPKMRTMLITFHRLHLSVFYMKGIYYAFAKRIADINYVKYVVRPQNKTNSFAILGKFSLAQAVLMLCLQLYGLYKELIAIESNVKYLPVQQHHLELSNNQIDNESKKCSLCLEIRQFTSLTVCGHLFCWACIQEWVRSKPECPLCRETLQPNKIVCLKNYD